MKPVITLYGPSKYPNNILEFARGLGNNITPFEVIFVGPTPPAFGLPDNFRYIETNVKPIQCSEIAVREALGDYIVLVSDDIEFWGEAPLDRLYALYQGAGDRKTVISCQYWADGVDCSRAHFLFKERYNVDIITAMAGFMSKEVFFEVGGYDRNFVYAFAIEDLILRIYAAGGHVELSDIVTNEITVKNLSDSLCHKGGQDWALLSELWVDGGPLLMLDGGTPTPPNSRFRETRLRPVESFTADKLLEVSQGSRVGWNFD